MAAHYAARALYRQQLLATPGPRRYLIDRSLGVLTRDSVPGPAGVAGPLVARLRATRLDPLVDDLSRRGTLARLLPTQLALPAPMLAARYASGDLLYRLHEGHVEPVVEPATIVLDTTPPTFGPVESVLQLVAHVLTTTLWAAGCDAILVSLDRPGYAHPLTNQADLVALWAARTLVPPDLAVALHTAARRPTGATILLTHHHLAREQRVIASPALRILTTHPPGDPPRRAPIGPYHLHLPPRPSAATVARAVAELLTPDGM